MLAVDVLLYSTTPRSHVALALLLMVVMMAVVVVVEVDLVLKLSKLSFFCGGVKNAILLARTLFCTHSNARTNTHGADRLKHVHIHKQIRVTTQPHRGGALFVFYNIFPTFFHFHWRSCCSRAGYEQYLTFFLSLTLTLSSNHFVRMLLCTHSNSSKDSRNPARLCVLSLLRCSVVSSTPEAGRSGKGSAISLLTPH